MDYDNWSRCSAKSVFQAHGIDGARKDEHSPPAQAPLCTGVLPETAGVPGWHVWVAGGGARHIGPRFPRASRANKYSHAEVEAGLIVLSSTPMAVGTMQGLTVRKSKSSRSNALTVSPYRLGGVLDSRLEERARYHLARTLDFTARGTKRHVARCRVYIP
jgi:hypothetical protein